MAGRNLVLGGARGQRRGGRVYRGIAHWLRGPRVRPIGAGRRRHGDGRGGRGDARRRERGRRGVAELGIR